MKLSEDRISHLSHRILDTILKEGIVEPLQPEERLLREIKRTITATQYEDEADAAARRTIQSLSRRVPEGSREWDVLYRKYVEEELSRRKKV
jgi:hypothetical protein